MLSAWTIEVPMKKKLVASLSIIVASITLGYLFFLSLLFGFLVGKYVAGKSAGERGRLWSIVIPLRRWGLHLHHWLYSLGLIALSSITGMHFLTPAITYGLLGGLVFQGIYCYHDWHVVLISRRRTAARDSLRGEAAIDAGAEVIKASGS